MSTPTDLALPKVAPLPPAEDQVTLPLSYVRDSARMLCMHSCRGGAHVRPCLVPMLDERSAG